MQKLQSSMRRKQYLMQKQRPEKQGVKLLIHSKQVLSCLKIKKEELTMEQNVKVFVQNVLKKIPFILTVSLLLGFAVTIMAGEKAKGIKSLSQEEQIKLVQSAAPPHISKDATIMVMGTDGKMVEARKGTNGFTCIPDIEGQETPDPMCGDAAAMQWANDLMSGAPKPTNAAPGIAYMARGGWIWVKDGKVTLTAKNDPGAKRMKEPPHWMLFWPIDSKTSGIPTMPGKFGTYVMYDGTPYSHLMIYQDPKELK